MAIDQKVHILTRCWQQRKLPEFYSSCMIIVTPTMADRVGDYCFLFFPRKLTEIGPLNLYNGVFGEALGAQIFINEMNELQVLHVVWAQLAS